MWVFFEMEVGQWFIYSELGLIFLDYLLDLMYGNVSINYIKFCNLISICLQSALKIPTFFFVIQQNKYKELSNQFLSKLRLLMYINNVNIIYV